MRKCLLFSLAALLLFAAAGSNASTLFRSTPDEFFTNYAGYTQGAKVVSHADLLPNVDPRVLTGWEEDGKVHKKASMIFADKVQHEWLIIDLGQVRPCGKISISSGLSDPPRVAPVVNIYGSTIGPDGPWTPFVENGDPSCKSNFMLENPQSRWLKFDFGDNADGIGSRVGAKFGVFKRFKLPETAELMKAFYPKFKRGYPGLEDFWKKIDAQDWEGAASALRTFEEKRAIKKSGSISQDYLRVPNLELENKEDFGNGLIFEFKQGIDWEIELDDALESPERGPFHGCLARAFLETGDERYSKKLIETLTSWMEQLPRPPDTEPSKYLMWATLGVAGRVGWWSSIQGMIVSDREHYSDKVFLNLFYNNWEQWDYLAHAGKEEGNWLAAVTRSVMQAGINWPEFADSQSWMDFAREKFEINVMRDVRSDGKETENSDGYQQFAYGILLGVYTGLKGAGVQIPPEVDRRIKLGQDWTSWMLMPNNHTFMIGDSNGGEGPGLVDRVARLFNRPDLLYMATQGKEGKTPSPITSRWWPVSGWFAMRSNWEERPFDQARQLIMTAAPYGGHGHQDQLNIYAYAYGRPLLWVPCRLNDSSYTMAGHWSTLYTWSKNTVVVDGKTQGFGDEPGVDRTCKNMSNFDGKNIVLADATHGIYPETNHRRRVLFVRGDYWIVIDDLTPKPGVDVTKSHTYDQHFHFKEGTDAISMPNGAVRTAYKTGANLMLVPLEPKKLAASEKTSIAVSYIGMDAPTMYGWKYQLKGQGSKRFVTVLYPYPNATVPRITVKKLASTPGVVALEVTTPKGKDIIYAGDKVAECAYSKTINAKAKAFVVRCDKTGKPVKLSALNAQNIKAGKFSYKGKAKTVEMGL